MALTAEDVARLVREVARHKKKTKIVVNYDGNTGETAKPFTLVFEKIELSHEEYAMLSERK